MTGGAERSRSALEDRVRGALAERVGSGLALALAGDTPFEDVGIDSLDIVVVLAELERTVDAAALTRGELWEVAGCVDSLVRHLGGVGD